MERQLPKVGEIWKGRFKADHYIIITRYLSDKAHGDLVEYEIIEKGHQRGTRYATAIMNHCSPVSYFDEASQKWMLE